MNIIFIFYHDYDHVAYYVCFMFQFIPVLLFFYYLWREENQSFLNFRYGYRHLTTIRNAADFHMKMIAFPQRYNRCCINWFINVYVFFFVKYLSIIAIVCFCNKIKLSLLFVRLICVFISNLSRIDKEMKNWVLNWHISGGKSLFFGL